MNNENIAWTKWQLSLQNPSHRSAESLCIWSWSLVLPCTFFPILPYTLQSYISFKFISHFPGAFWKSCIGRTQYTVANIPPPSWRFSDEMEGNTYMQTCIDSRPTYFDLTFVLQCNLKSKSKTHANCFPRWFLSPTGISVSMPVSRFW